MKARMLKDLSDKELKELYKNNHDIQEQAWRDAYDCSMELQREEGEQMGAEVFDYHDHYSSFYLTTPIRYGTKCPELVAHRLKDPDYLTKDNAKLYKKLNDLIDKWEDLTYDEQQEEKGEQIYDEAIKACDELAEGVTTQLRAYEDINDEHVLDDFLFNASEGYMSEWTINKEGVVTETIYKTYK